MKALAAGEPLKGLRDTPLYRNAYYLIADVTVVSVLGFAFWTLAARIYSPAQVGLASATIAVIGLLARLSRLGFDFGLVRFLTDAGERGGVLINSCFTIAGLASLAAASVFLAGLSLWSPALLYLRHPAFAIFFVLLTMAYAVFLLTEQAFIARRLARYALFKNTVAGIVKIAAVILLPYVLNGSGILAGWGLAVFIGLAAALFRFLPRIQPGYTPLPSVDRKIIKDMLRYSLVNYIAELLWLAPLMLFPLIVINTLGAEMNAYFYMPWTIAQMLFAIPMATASSLFAEGSYDEHLLQPNIYKSLNIILLILVPVVALLFPLSDRLLLVFGNSYSEAGAILLRILAVSAFPAGINYIGMSVMRVKKNIGGVILLSASVACLSLGSGYVLMTGQGLPGIGIAWLATQTLAAVVVASSLLFRYHRKTRVAE